MEDHPKRKVGFDLTIAVIESDPAKMAARIDAAQTVIAARVEILATPVAPACPAWAVVGAHGAVRRADADLYHNRKTKSVRCLPCGGRVGVWLGSG